MDDFKGDVFDIIKSVTGHQNIITVNVAFVDFVEDLEVGLFLSQLIYWSDKGAREDGFIFKTDNEWNKELRLSKYALRKARKRLEEMKLLETKVKKANGNPTVHYKFNKEAFVQQFTWFLRNRKKENSIPEERKFEKEFSLTDTTAETTTETKEKTKRVVDDHHNASDKSDGSRVFEPTGHIFSNEDEDIKKIGYS